MRSPLLLQLSVSPWSEKARWALDHHGIAYQRREHTPLLGEPSLRLRLRRLSGVSSVPVLFVDGGAVEGALAIARWADAHGRGTPLCADPIVAEWNERSDRSLSIGRVRLLSEMLRSREALAESLPPMLPMAARRALAPMAAMGVRWLGRKYPVGIDASQFDQEIMRELAPLREALQGGRATILSDFSFADIAMAATLQEVRPVDHPEFPLLPATRAAWTNERLAAELGDLLRWRDEVYAAHRKGRTR